MLVRQRVSAAKRTNLHEKCSHPIKVLRTLCEAVEQALEGVPRDGVKAPKKKRSGKS